MPTIDEIALDWVARESQGLTDAERKEFDAWYRADIRHKGGYLRARAVNNALNRVAIQPALIPTRDELEAELSPPQPVPFVASSRRAFVRYGAMAAGVAVLTATALVPDWSRKEAWSAAKGEIRKFALADQSRVTINGGSRIEARMGGKQREVALLEGEAWFAVAKDKHKPFIVAAGDVHARAVGTAFGVRRHANGAEVLVSEGVVEVWSDQGSAQARVLTAGESAFVPDRAASIVVKRQPDEIERRLAWREGNLVFVNQALGEAVQDFNRYSAKRIVINDPALARQQIVGKYPTGAAERFARDVSAYLDVPIVVTADTILIGKAPKRQAGEAAI